MEGNGRRENYDRCYLLKFPDLFLLSEWIQEVQIFSKNFTAEMRYLTIFLRQFGVLWCGGS